MRRSSMRRIVLATAAAAAAPSVVLASFTDAPGQSPIKQQRVKNVDRSENYQGYPFGLVGPAASSLLGGTSGTYVGPGNNTFFGYNDPATPSASWSGAGNWDPSVPNNGGQAFIGRPGELDDIERQDSVSPTLDINVTLDSIIADNELASGILSSASNNTITTAANGLRIENRSGLPTPFTNSFIFAEGFRIYPQITGAASVSVVGPAGGTFPTPVNLIAANNNFSGGLFVTGGGIALIDEDPPDLPNDEPGINFGGEAVLGNGTISLDGGNIWITSSAPLPTPVNMTKGVHLGAGGGTILSAGAPAQFDNVFSGPGGLNLVFPTNKTFTGTNTLTGNVFVGTGKVTLRDGGSMLNVPVIEAAGKLELNNAFQTANRLGDNSRVEISSAKFNLVGSFDGPFTEKVGTVSFSGYATATVQTQPGALTTLAADDLVRNGRGVLFFRGENVGTAGAEGSRFTFTNTPTLVGAGGSGSQASIIPFAVAATYATGALPADESTAAHGQIGRATLATYDPVRGVVPLSLTSDYSLNFVGANSTSNVKVDAPTVFTGTMNSLVMGNAANSDTPGGGAPLTGGQLTVTSGVILGNSNGAVINNPVTTPASDLLVISTSQTAGTDATGNNGLRFSGVISGNMNVTKAGHGNVYFYAANTYTGETAMIGGRTVINASVLPNQPSPFGQAPATTPIRIIGASTGPEGVAGLDISRLFTVNNVEIGRNMILEGSGFGGLQIGAIAPGTLLISGNVDHTAAGGAVLSGTISISGNITGNSNFTDASGLFLTLSGNNAGWSGGFEFAGAAAATAVNPTTIRVASSNALGTGEIFMSGPARLTTDGSVRTITNRIVLDPSDADYLVLDGNINVAGDVIGASFTRTFIVPGGANVEISGDLLNSGFAFKGSGTLGTGSNSTIAPGGGVVTLSGNNNNNGRIFIGGTTPTSTANGGRAPVKVRLASDGAMGAAGMQMNVDGAVVELFGGRNMPDRNIFIRGLGDGGGALQSAGGNNAMAGNIILLNSGTVGSGLAGIGVAPGTTLTVTGDLSDITGDTTTTPPTPDGGVFRKQQTGTLVLPRIVDAEAQPDGTFIARYLTGFEIAAGNVQISQGASNNLPAKVSAVRGFSITQAQEVSAGKLDLTNNSMVVDYTSPTSPRATLEGLIAEGRAGGNWTGNGITSSTAAAGPSGRFALGIAEVADTGFGGTFLGVPIDSDAVLIRFTLSGDLNIDGMVDFNDFALFGPGFNGPARWATGDFTYDGVKDLSDFALLAANFNQSAGDLPRSSVPEPAALGAIGLALGLMARRRRA